MRDALLFAYMVTRVIPQEKKIPSHRVTRIAKVAKSYTHLELDPAISKEEENYTLDQIKNYLDSDTLDQARSDLIVG